MTTLVSLKRIARFGWQNFARQGYLSFATCLVLGITLSLVGFIYLSRVSLDFLIDSVRQKADISVYFQEDCLEETMFELKDEISALQTVSSTELILKEEALQRFIDRHRSEEHLMTSLIEIGTNPFLASLNIKASGVEEYEEIALALSAERFQGVIQQVDYHKRKPVIEKIFQTTEFIGRAGLIVAGIFIATSIVISFNTARLTINQQKDEVSVMRLVGASNGFISGGYLVQGILCGIVSALAALVIVAASAFFLTPRLTAVFPEFQLFSFLLLNLNSLIVITLLSGFFLGIIPTYLAIVKYLRI